jgi:hypothetical protein
LKTGLHDDGLRSFPSGQESLERRLQIVWPHDHREGDANSNCMTYAMDFFHENRRENIGRIGQHDNFSSVGDGIPHKLHELARQLSGNSSHSGDVAARPSKAFNEAVTYGVAGAGHDDWNGLRGATRR